MEGLVWLLAALLILLAVQVRRYRDNQKHRDEEDRKQFDINDWRDN